MGGYYTYDNFNLKETKYYMKDYYLTTQERQARNKIAADTRAMISRVLSIEDQDESSLMMIYEDYYLQVSFSGVHPLIVIYLAKTFESDITPKRLRALNDLNLKSVLGGHALNQNLGCYSYRATNWLDNPLSEKRFFEILGRCIDEAQRGYRAISCAA